MSDTHKAEIVTTAPRAYAIERERELHPLVQAATQAGTFDPATLERLMDLQERWEAGQAKKAYTRAMANLKNDLPRVLRRDKEVKFKDVKYTHTSLAEAVEKIVPVLTSHGFSHSWVPRTADRRVEVTCRLTHTEGHSEECTLDAEPDKSGMKSGPQSIASTITLLQRYSLLALLGIATADMKEPDPAEEDERASVDRIDAAQNMRAAAAIVRAGRTREAAEEHVGKPVSKWTTNDLATLRDWLRTPAPTPRDDVRPEDFED